MTAVILMKNWIMSMTSTPQSPECAAKTTLSTPTTSSVCQRAQAEEDVGDLARGEVHGRHDHAVEEEPEVDRAEAAHDAGRFAGVADLVKLEVGHDARAAPEPRVEEDRRHAGEHERPPAPSCPRRRCVRTMSVTRFGVSLLKVVATIESPASHHGTARPEAKNSGGVLAGALAEEQRRDKADEEVTATMTQSMSCKCIPAMFA